MHNERVSGSEAVCDSADQGQQKEEGREGGGEKGYGGLSHQILKLLDFTFPWQLMSHDWPHFPEANPSTSILRIWIVIVYVMQMMMCES